MCGIVGYVGTKKVVPVIVEGLRRLEYRGYDSAGIAVGRPGCAKLEVWRAETGEGLLHPNDPHIVAVASDVKVETRLPLFGLDDPDGIAAFIVDHQKLA